MSRTHVIYQAGRSAEPAVVAFTAEEEAAADAEIAQPRKVAKSLITQRLIDAGMIAAAMSALQSDSAAYARWIAADQPAVNSDDAATLELLAAIGADPAVILAS